MVSVENRFKNLRVKAAQGTLLGEKRLLYGGVPSTAELTLNVAGADALVAKGHKPLISGDRVRRGQLSIHDSPEQKEIAFEIITKLHQPVEKDADGPLKHLRNVEVFPVGADWFQ